MLSSDSALIDVESPESRRIAVHLARRATQGMDPARIAAEVAAIWVDIDATLRPILGQRGVASLCRRSLHLTTGDHPWLGGVQESVNSTLDIPALEAALAAMDSLEAAAGAGDLLQAFHELLASLVGASLTDQLLGSIWANHSRGDAAQDAAR